jgi:hypothetical protein
MSIALWSPDGLRAEWSDVAASRRAPRPPKAIVLAERREAPAGAVALR